jgi:hypothetical protein
MRHAANCAVVAVAIMVTAASTGPRLIFVDDDAAGTNNGSSWVDAYKYLQDALADARTSAKPVEIRVAQGVYKPWFAKVQPTAWGPPSFQLINGVAVQGGYAGSGASDPNARDALEYVSVLSGDHYGDDGPEWESGSDNASHIRPVEPMPRRLWMASRSQAAMPFLETFPARVAGCSTKEAARQS